MRGKFVTGGIRSVVTSVVVVIAALALCVPATLSLGIQLLTNTLVVIAGNDNPAGLTPKMQQELGGDPWYPEPNTNQYRPVGTFGQGYLDTANNPGSPYYGWDFIRVEWPAKIGLPSRGGLAYEPQQLQGLHNVDRAITDVLATLNPGEKAVAVGYSSSANVLVREMRNLQGQPSGAPPTDQLGFFLMGNTNRPNGGILQRFPGLYIPDVDIRFDGSTPIDTPYATTDIGWEYDTASDFPLYPLNLLADLNAVFAGPITHSNYFNADVNGPRAFPDTTVGNITYITLRAPHLPLLLPFYYAGFPKPLLDLVEPALTVMIDWSYDRSISPGTPTTARLIPNINPITAIGDLAKAVVEGMRRFSADLQPAVPAVPAQAAARYLPRPLPTVLTATQRQRTPAIPRRAATAQRSTSAAATPTQRQSRAVR
ncbi:MAG: PE-PPE domain-containing protein [Actinomycetes bacterium]